MAKDQSEFSDQDLFNPVYCIRCKHQIPRAKLTDEGLCPECFKELHPEQINPRSTSLFGEDEEDPQEDDSDFLPLNPAAYPPRRNPLDPESEALENTGSKQGAAFTYTSQQTPPKPQKTSWEDMMAKDRDEVERLTEKVSFNLGAFCIPLIWTLGNKVYTWFAVAVGLRIFSVITIGVRAAQSMGGGAQSVVGTPSLSTGGLTILSLLCNLAYLGMAIYLGFKGNALAWEAGSTRDIHNFKNIQKIWAIAGIVVILLIILSHILSAIVRVKMLDLSKQMMKSMPVPTQQQQYQQHQQFQQQFQNAPSAPVYPTR